MLTLEDIASRRKRIRVNIAGAGELNITINIGALCRAERDKYFLGEDPDKALKDYLSAVIAEWDLLLAPGEPAPVCADTFDRLPDGVIERISRAISRETGEPEGEAPGSGTGS
ncbi:MAG: hypothetical protein IK083_07980 [Abditibacteriota bacterium]|nr:hypothetical protein [Abditibacteriota bacterium]